jgi:hypothetical protein
MGPPRGAMIPIASIRIACRVRRWVATHAMASRCSRASFCGVMASSGVPNVSRASLHLDEHVLVAIPRDEVDLALAAAPVALDHVETAVLQVCRREQLTAPAKFVLCRHPDLHTRGCAAQCGRRSVARVTGDNSGIRAAVENRGDYSAVRILVMKATTSSSCSNGSPIVSAS